MTFRSLALTVVAAVAFGLTAQSQSNAHGPHDYGHPNPWGYYHGYPSYGGEYWLRHHHHYVYRPHNWCWHPDIHGYVYNGWGGNHGGGYGGQDCFGAGGGPLYYQEGAAATPTTMTPPTGANPASDDLPGIPELP